VHPSRLSSRARPPCAQALVALRDPPQDSDGPASAFLRTVFRSLADSADPAFDLEPAVAAKTVLAGPPACRPTAARAAAHAAATPGVRSQLRLAGAQLTLALACTTNNRRESCLAWRAAAPGALAACPAVLAAAPPGLPAGGRLGWPALARPAQCGAACADALEGFVARGLCCAAFADAAEALWWRVMMPPALASRFVAPEAPSGAPATLRVDVKNLQGAAPGAPPALVTLTRPAAADSGAGCPAAASPVASAECAAAACAVGGFGRAGLRACCAGLECLNGGTRPHAGNCACECPGAYVGRDCSNRSPHLAVKVSRPARPARVDAPRPARGTLPCSPRAPCLAAGTRRCQDTPLTAAPCVRGFVRSCVSPRSGRSQPLTRTPSSRVSRAPWTARARPSSLSRRPRQPRRAPRSAAPPRRRCAPAPRPRTAAPRGRRRVGPGAGVSERHCTPFIIWRWVGGCPHPTEQWL
jgi:hypothetical protein